MANKYWSLLLVFISWPACAAEASGVGAGWGELFRVTATLGFIVLLILGLSVAARRWQGERRFGTDIFKVLAAISLGNKDKIYLIQVGNEQIVVGSSIGRLTTLHTMKENIAITASDAAVPAVSGAFAEVLRSLGKGTGQ